MMKTAAALLLALLASKNACAFVAVRSPTTCTGLTTLSLTDGDGPQNGGVDGSNLVPGQYGRIDHSSPYGNSRAKSQGQNDEKGIKRSSNSNAAPADVKGGPVNGGTGGSSMMPGQYGQIDHNSPYGADHHSGMTGGNRAQRQRSGNDGDGSNRRNDPSGRRPGMTGGAGGSSMVPDQHDRIDHSSPY